jgi:hypothetical protein
MWGRASALQEVRVGEPSLLPQTQSSVGRKVREVGAGSNRAGSADLTCLPPRAHGTVADA